MTKLSHLTQKWYPDIHNAMVTTTDQGFLITMDDDETFWTIEARVRNGVLVVTQNSEEPV